MDAQRGPGGGPPGRWPRQWWHGPPGRTGRPGEGHGAGEAADGDGGHGRPRWPWRSTLLFTAFVLAGSQFAAHSQEGERAALDPAARVLLFVAGALLLWRWRRPVPVLCATVAAVLLYNAAGYPYGPVFLTVAVACFSAVVSGHRHAAWAAMGAFWAGHVLIAQLLYRWLPPSGDGAVSWNEEIVVATWVVALVAVSELVRTRREQWARERAERARAARRRADEERLRIARELHDVLAHSISVIHVQAGVGLALLDSDPEQARTALTTIKAQSKEALGEVRQVLDTLRAPGAAPRAPAPGLDRLSELVEQAAGAGLTVTVEGEPPALPRRGPGRLPHRPGGPHQRRTALRLARGPGAHRTGRRPAAAARRRRRTRHGRRRGRRRQRARRDAGAGRRAGWHHRGGPAPGRRVPGARRTAARVRGGPVIRVLLADDQSLVRAGFRALLDAQPDIEVAGEASDGEEAVRLVRALRPDVVLMDIRMPVLDGLAATRRVTGDAGLGEVKVVMLTTFELDEYVFEAIRSGASGFLVKDTEPEELLRAVRAVVEGDALLSPGVTRRLIAEFAARSKEPAAAGGLAALTEREREVMALVGIGLSNEEIARRLVVSPLTAKTHVSRTMVKLGARDRAQLVVLAYETGLVRPGWLG